MKLRFLGDFKKLEKCVLRTGIPGKWREHENRQKQYRTDDGAMLSWWESTKTLLFEGQKARIPKFKRAFVKVATKRGLLGGVREPDDEIADLPGVISEIAKLKMLQKRMRFDAAELKRQQKRMRIEIAQLQEAETRR
jgi:hypothetical protein